MKITYLARAVVLLLIVLMTTIVATSTSPNASEKSSPAVIKTYLRADLSLKTVFSPDFLPATKTRTAAAAAIRTCSCSCGQQTCTGDEDCDGGTCNFFISCNCSNSPRKDALSGYFAQKETLSSHKNPAHVNVAVNCKQ